MPNKLSDELSRTAARVDARLSAGDRAGEPRRVDHTASFRSKTATERAMTELEVAGYEVVRMQRRLLRVIVQFARNDVVDHQAAAEFTREVVTVLNQQGGTYEGWDAPLVT